MLLRVASLFMAGALVCSCASTPTSATNAASERPAAAVAEVWRTAAYPADNVDSVAWWHSPDDRRHLAIATSKQLDRLLVFDAFDGSMVQTIGASGPALGQFRRPNGIAVVGDLVFVVERDNRRVQVLRAPAMTPLGAFGADQLRKPYGLCVVPVADGTLRVLVTDDYERPRNVAKALPLLGERVRDYTVTVEGNALTATYAGSFGDTSEAGALLKVESILADPETGLLFIGDEDRDDVKVYDLAGQFTGRTLGTGYIREDSEGIALVPDATAPEGGYLIVTEQRMAVSRFHVYSRRGTQHLGVVTGAPLIANTDGIWAGAHAFGPFVGGAFLAVDNDAAVVAYRWADVTAALPQP